MIIEILGAKMLSPYFGTSHFVWTAQIAVTLVALACGYYLGGRWVDENPRPTKLYQAILAASLWLAATVGLTERIALGFFGAITSSLAAATLGTAAVLYFVPLLLLAMTGPFLVRVLTSDMRQMGGSAGRLSALSTLGSFVGTILIGYILIPLLPNSRTMFGTALILGLQAAIYLLVWGRSESASRSILPAILTALAISGIGWAGLQNADHTGREMQFGTVTFYEKERMNSNYGMLQVMERKDGRIRLYLNDYLCQNTFDPVLHQSFSLFTYMLHGLARAYCPDAQDVLAIGLGVGIAPMEFAREGARVDVVEINPVVVGLAEKWFELDRKKLNIALGDGRQFVNNVPDRRYDVILLDAFLGDSSPSHLMTQEAFAGMHRVLKPNGVLVINAFGHFEPGQDFLSASLYNTLKTVFGAVLIHSSNGGNIFFAASDRSPLIFLQKPTATEVHPAVQAQAAATYLNLVEITPGQHRSANALDPLSGMVLTDDFNPVEFRDAPNREQLRRRLVTSLQPGP